MIARQETRIGLLTMEAEHGLLLQVILPGSPVIPRGHETIQTESQSSEDKKILEAAFLQIQAYLEGNRKTFSIPFQFYGSPFQEKIWNALLRIPYGETRTYGELASMAEKPLAFRAAGGACHQNPLPILIPCHRVVAAKGLGGFGGGLKSKTFLLTLEQKHRL